MCSVAQSCPALHDPMDCSLPGSSIHGILQARILEWVAMPSSRGSSQPRDGTQVFSVSYTGRWILYHCTAWEAHLVIWIVPKLVGCSWTRVTLCFRRLFSFALGDYPLPYNYFSFLWKYVFAWSRTRDEKLSLKEQTGMTFILQKRLKIKWKENK